MSDVETIILVVYGLGVLATCYICGRFGEDELVFIPALLWPAFILWAVPLLFLNLGRKHGGRR